MLLDIFFLELWNSDLEGNVCERLMSTRNELYCEEKKESKYSCNGYQTEECGTGIDVTKIFF